MKQGSRANRHRVRKDVWQKWSDHARRVFNLTYETLNGNQLVMTHPHAEKIPHYQWQTICWNAAWIAANAVDGFKTKVAA